MKLTKATCGHYDKFPEIRGWTGRYDLEGHIFYSDSDPQVGYWIPLESVYVPELDGEIFPVEKYMTQFGRKQND